MDFYDLYQPEVNAEIKLLGKIEGQDTDDVIVFVVNSDTSEKRKLPGQVKHSVKFIRNGDGITAVIAFN